MKSVQNLFKSTTSLEMQTEHDRVIESQRTRQHYTEKYLRLIQKEGKDGKKEYHQSQSAQFLDDTRYNIELDKLYKLESTCVYHQAMPYQPTLIKIISEDIQKHFEGNQYLLTVWNIDGKKIFQRALKNPIEQWEICWEFFIFKTQEETDEDDYFQIVNLEEEDLENKDCSKNKAIMKVRVDDIDYVFKNMCYYEGILIFATRHEIKLCHVPFQKDQELTIEGDDLKTISGFEHTPIWDITLDKEKEMEIQVWVEECDKQIKAYALNLNYENIKFGPIKKDNVEYILVENREYLNRNERHGSGGNFYTEKIRKFKVVYPELGVSHAVALRGDFVDIYYNGICRDSKHSDNCDLTFIDVDITFASIVFEYKDYHHDWDGSGDKPNFGTQYRILDRSYGSKMTFDNAKTLRQKWNMATTFHDLVRRNIRLISGYMLVETNLFVSHNNAITIFAIDTKINTRTIEEEFKNLIINNSTDESGFIKDIQNLIQYSTQDNQNPIHHATTKQANSYSTAELEGENQLDIERIERDHIEQNCQFQIVNTFYFDADIHTIFRIFNGEKDSPMRYIGVIRHDNIVDVMASSEPKEYTSWKKIDPIPLQGDTFVSFHKDYQSMKYPIIMSKQNDENTTEDKVYICTIQNCQREDLEEQIITELQNNQLESEFQPIRDTHKLISLYEQENEHGKQSNKFVLQQEQNLFLFSIIEKENNLLDDEYNQQDQKDVILMIQYEEDFRISTNGGAEIFEVGVIDEKQLLLINEKNIFKFWTNKKDDDEQDDVIWDINWKDFFITPDLNHLYTISRESLTHNTTQGLKYYDFKDFRDKFTSNYEDRSYNIKSVRVGNMAQIDYSQTQQRLTYQHDFETISIIHLPHKNTISLMAQPEFDQVLCQRQIKDRFHVLNKDGQLMTWNTTTGKLLKIVDMSQTFRKVRQWQKLGHEKNPDLYQHGHTNYSIVVGELDDEEKVDRKSEKMLKRRDTILKTKDKEGHKVFNQLSFEDSLDAERKKMLVIQIKDQDTLEIKFAFKHIWYKGEQQVIYFNNDTTKMIELLQDSRINLYQLIPQKNVKYTHYQVQYIQKTGKPRKFVNFPEKLLTPQLSYINNMTPCFEWYVDFDSQEKIYIVRDTMSGNALFPIPSYLINFKGKFTNHKNLPQVKTETNMFNRFKWISKNYFKVISDDGIEKLVQIQGAEEKDADFSQSQRKDNSCYERKKVSFKQIQYRFIFEADSINFQDYNYYYNKEPHYKDIEQIFLQKVRDYRDVQLFSKEEYKAYSITYPSLLNLNDMHESEHHYERLSGIDFHQSVDRKRYIISQSYSYLCWKLIEQLQQEKIKLKNVNENTVQEICYNILPNGETVMTYCHKSGKLIEKIYKKSVENVGLEIKQKYHVPILMNFKERTVFDLNIEGENYKAMNVHLQYLKHYHKDCHSRYLCKYLSKCMEFQLPELPDYFDNRSLATSQTNMIKKASIKDSHTGSTMVSHIWDDPKQFEELYETNQKNIEVRMKFIDIPQVFNIGDPLQVEYYQKLGQVEDLEIFDVLVIQKQIEYNFHRVKSVVFRKQMVPFLLMFLLFYFESYAYDPEFQKSDQPIYIDMVNTCGFINIFISVYFLLLEIDKIIQTKGLGYFSNFYNQINFATPFSIIMLAVIQYSEIEVLNEPSVILIILTCTDFLLWLKLLNFIRLFRSIGFYVSSVFTVIEDTRYFVIVMMLFFLAFGDALRIANIFNADGSDQDILGGNGFIDGFMYIYSQATGNFELTDTGVVDYNWTNGIVVLSSYFNLIVMMNLIIAVVSDSFQRFLDSSNQALLKTQAQIIGEYSPIVNSTQTDYESDQSFLLYIISQAEIDGQVSEKDQERNLIKSMSLQQNDFIQNVSDQMEYRIISRVKTMIEDLQDSLLETKKERNESYVKQRDIKTQQEKKKAFDGNMKMDFRKMITKKAQNAEHNIIE